MDDPIRRLHFDFDLFFRATSEALLVLDGHGILVAANPSAVTLLGGTEGPLLGSAFDDLLDPEGTPGMGPNEVNLRRGDSESFPAELSRATIESPSGGPLIVVTLRDRSKAYHQMETLRQSSEKFARVFTTSPDGITVTRQSDGRYLEINPGFSLLSGYQPEEVLGKNSIELKIWGSLDERERFLAELQEKGEVLNFEAEFQFKHGQVRTTLVSARPVEMEGVPCILSTTRDITEKKRLEESLVKIQRLESLGILAGGIAHDFNNLLASLLGYIELARELLQKGKPDRVREFLDKALGVYARVKGLTRQLLTFSKGGSPNLQTIHLGPTLKEAATFSLSGSTVIGEFHLDEGLWPCHCDETQIAQVVDNLVLNAVQAMPDGGRVTIAATNVDSVPGHPGRYLQVSVSDDGPGIDPAQVAKIFDPFFTTKASGHGLGLATAFSIVQRHHGWIDVETALGAGSTFRMFLPASEEALIGAEAERPMEHRGQGDILVVDDDPKILEVVRHWLETMGYRVTTARDGTVGLRK